LSTLSQKYRVSVSTERNVYLAHYPDDPSSN